MTSEMKSRINNDLFRDVALRIVQRTDLLAACSQQEGELTRTFCTSAMSQAHEQMSGWMEATGMTVSCDAAGNLVGCHGTGNRPALMIGSHLDTVVNAGKFDGALGILIGLGVAELCSSAGIELPFDVKVVAFCEEEGVRFRFPFIGSLGMAGMLEADDLEVRDDDGVSIAEALKEFGCDQEIQSAVIAPDRLIGFIEPHIEQAVELQEADLAVGVVTAIAGQTRAIIEFTGQAGHAGTVPHHLRKDALAAAAEFILAVESSGKKSDGLFATVGNLHPSPGLSNVIAGTAEVRLDLRHESDSVREDAFKELVGQVRSISEARGIKGTVVAVQHTPACPMDNGLIDSLSSAIGDAGAEPKRMVSGAGHDAMIMANVWPAGMLFIRCKDGVSHHPDEFVSAADIETALRVTFGAVLNLAGSGK